MNQEEDPRETWLSTSTVAGLMDVSDRWVRQAAAAAEAGQGKLLRNAKLVARKLPRNAGGPAERYEIRLDSLPAPAQLAYARSVNAVPLKVPEGAAPDDVSQEEREALWQRFERAPPGCQRKARRSLDMVCGYVEREQHGISKSEIARSLRHEFGREASATTLWRLLRLVKGHELGLWLPLLLPRYTGKEAHAEFTEAAWLWISEQWLQLSKPALKPIWRRALERGKPLGWKIPSVDTVQARLDALPGPVRILRRDGEEALSRLYPAQRRDYATLAVHEMWVADGRRADVFVRWEDGQISRPILVAWVDVRSRVCLAHLVGKTESADLIRLAFRRAALTAHALPDAALLDNGMGFAGKMLSGGVPTRFRFKVQAEDPLGIFPAMGIEVIWTTPRHGQSKPIERFFGTIAEMEKRLEFGGAYCGNRPDAKPEDCDSKNAVPIALYRQILAEEIPAYHKRSHRGDGMGGKSPRQVYEELLPLASPKQPTAAQLRLCLLAAESVKPNRVDHSVSVLGNRYWSQELVGLRCDINYTVRFDPEDARQPVSVYDRGRFICDAQLIDKTGFRDQPAAKEHARARNDFKRAAKQQARALQRMAAAESWTPGPACTAAKSDGSPEQLPSPKVVKLMPATAAQNRSSTPPDDDNLGITDDEVSRLLADARRHARS